MGCCSSTTLDQKLAARGLITPDTNVGSNVTASLRDAYRSLGSDRDIRELRVRFKGQSGLISNELCTTADGGRFVLFKRDGDIWALHRSKLNAEGKEIKLRLDRNVSLGKGVCVRLEVCSPRGQIEPM